MSGIHANNNLVPNDFDSFDNLSALATMFGISNYF